MRRGGIRLIGIFFLFWAISNLAGLIKGIRPPRGFMGIDLGITYNGEAIGFMAWLGVCILFYTGLQLMRFDIRGRTWALIVLWTSAIGGGSLFVLSLILTATFLIRNTSSYMTFHVLNRSLKLEPPIRLPLVMGAFFVFYAFQVYFLMKKDVKMEFQKTVEVKEVS